MKENKAQWNHRIKPELADAMKRLQRQRNSMQNNTQSLRDLTEEALAFYLKASIHIKAHAAMSLSALTRLFRSGGILSVRGALAGSA